MSNIPMVVIVGRMNVGKSTLFNRLSTSVKSITLDYSGVTRDFMKDTVNWRNHTFELIDSGGIRARDTTDEILEKVRHSVTMLVQQAAVIVLVVDGTIGITAEDLEIAGLLHKTQKPVIVVINKADAAETQEHKYEFMRLGFKEYVTVSAEHGTNINQLLDTIIAYLPTRNMVRVEQKPTYKVVLLGRPNVGKSSLLNLLLQKERAIVSSVPGTTREAISESITFYRESIEITDTPGVRRKRAIEGSLEPLMVKSSFGALKEGDIIVLLIDAQESALVDQELKLAFYAFTEHYKSLIILINKADLITDRIREQLEISLDFYKHFIKKVPLLYISCKTGKNIGRILPLIHELWERANQQFDDIVLTRLFQQALQQKPLYHQTKPLAVYRVRQLARAPITIGMAVNEPLWFGPAQRGFFENLLRSEYHLIGVPIKFVIKKTITVK